MAYTLIAASSPLTIPELLVQSNEMNITEGENTTTDDLSESTGITQQRQQETQAAPPEEMGRPTGQPEGCHGNCNSSVIQMGYLHCGILLLGKYRWRQCLNMR